MENFTELFYESGIMFGSTGVWFLIGAALVFFMQCGFAMVESGFTRAKNAGNIIMKNLMDFCVGTVVFVLIGYSLMCGESNGFIGKLSSNIFSDFGNFEWGNFVFNLVFCATAATIVSGAMAERTKFSSYLIYSAVISAVVYPIEAGWVWNANGWLYQLNFVDFAGSAAIHTVGGLSALIGAAFLGARLGKYSKGKDGKVKVHAIPGHSLTLGALGVFILWFGWYGFNGAAASNNFQLAQIFGTTTIAAAVATCATMAFTWIKNGKPDVSMTLNGSLAGLVAITAGCANVDAFGAAIIGLVAGILIVVAVEMIDLKFHVDDPVGAVGVHMVNGIWGTIAVGLFNIYENESGLSKGLFYGGGFKQLGIQLLGIGAIVLWTTVLMVVVFFMIKKTHGLRVTPEEEIQGLDSTEHGLVSAYADFMPSVSVADFDSSETPVNKAPVDHSVPVQVMTEATPIASDIKLSKVSIICKQNKFEELKEALNGIGVTGITVTQVLGCGAQKGRTKYRGVEVDMILLPKVKVEVIVSKVPVADVINIARKALYTGNFGDGKIFVYNVENVIKVRTGEQGYEALQDATD
ncbi:ammonium transporter [Kineothrix sedimenti]|uniref:Ammonium transporter n=1 Tax=Kineothrix sedimenti TaxID=3123317 RepID=A0ABZ3EWN7_9FIRM